jgi:hypothetical protein
VILTDEVQPRAGYSPERVVHLVGGVAAEELAHEPAHPQVDRRRHLGLRRGEILHVPAHQIAAQALSGAELRIVLVRRVEQQPLILRVQSEHPHGRSLGERDNELGCPAP